MFLQSLIVRLNKFSLEVAEDKTNIMVFSRCKSRAKTSFNFLGFEFRWGLSRRKQNFQTRIPIIKRSTSREKQRASLAKFKVWLKKYCRLPKTILFAMLNRKLRGYYNYYGIIGNFKSLNTFIYHVKRMLFKWLNRRSQRRSYNWKGFNEMIKHFKIAKPRICHDF